MKTMILALGGLIFCSSAWANQQWRCQNMVAIEVCDQKHQCVERKTTHSAFEISLSAKQNVSICNSNHCWKGQAQKNTAHPREVVQVSKFPWRTVDVRSEQYILMIHPTQNRLYLQSDRKKLPLQCISI